MPLRLAVSLTSITWPVVQSIEWAFKNRFSGIILDARNQLRPSELTDTGRRDFLHLLKERDLYLTALSFPTRRCLYDQQDLDGRIQALKRTVDFAAKLKCRSLITRPGRIPDDPASPTYKLLTEVLSDLVSYADHHGVSLALTPTIDSPAALLSLLSSIHTGHVTLDFDTAQFALAKHDPVAALQSLHTFVTQIHLRDAVAELDGTGREVRTGKGDVPWDELLPLANQLEPPPWLIASRNSGESIPDDLLHAAKLARSLLPGL